MLSEIDEEFSFCDWCEAFYEEEPHLFGPDSICPDCWAEVLREEEQGKCRTGCASHQ